MQQISISGRSCDELNNLIESYKATGWRLKTKTLHPEMHQYHAVMENGFREHFTQPAYETNRSMDVKC